jgi:hypothetical protein
MTSEHAGALERFDADLFIAAHGASPALQRLRRRAVAVYRNALAEAAGKPFDPRWQTLAQIVAAFVQRVRDGRRSSNVRAAVDRLARLNF